jgi:hypothetical protein
MVITTFDFVVENQSVKDAFDVLNTVFLAIFSLESAFQLMYHLKQLFGKAWLTFDLLLVMSSWALINYSSLPLVFRALRVLRIAARVKSVKSILMALITAIPKVGEIFDFYIFAVMISAN